jgi:hypothetical protein
MADATLPAMAAVLGLNAAEGVVMQEPLAAPQR